MNEGIFGFPQDLPYYGYANRLIVDASDATNVWSGTSNVTTNRSGFQGNSASGPIAFPITQIALPRWVTNYRVICIGGGQAGDYGGPSGIQAPATTFSPNGPGYTSGLPNLVANGGFDNQTNTGGSGYTLFFPPNLSFGNINNIVNGLPDHYKVSKSYGAGSRGLSYFQGGSGMAAVQYYSTLITGWTFYSCSVADGTPGIPGIGIAHGNAGAIIIDY